MINFTMIENDIMDKNISDGAFRLYTILKSYCFGNKTTCFPCEATLSNRMKKSIRTIQRYINELIQANLIKKKRRGSISNLYEILRKTVENKVEEIKKKLRRIIQIKRVLLLSIAIKNLKAFLMIMSKEIIILLT